MADRKKTAIQEYLERLIRARPNDAVKLAFLKPEDADRIGRMDLSLLSEIKRGGNGSVEIKLIDRGELLERLAEMQNAGAEEKAVGANFYEALDRAAGLLGGKTREDEE